MKWVKGIRRYIENKIVNPHGLETLAQAMEWAEEQTDVVTPTVHEDVAVLEIPEVQVVKRVQDR